MKKKLYIAGVLMASVLTAVLLTTTAPTYADSSTTHIIIKNDQEAIASGIEPNVQNCAQNNIDALLTSGDEGVDCHNQRDESSETTATD
jgi:peptidoglycan hydrolase CwlO-like protein